MRNLILAAFAAIVAVAGYLWFTGEDRQEPLAGITEKIGAPVALDSASSSIGDAAQVASTAAEAATAAASATATAEPVAAATGTETDAAAAPDATETATPAVAAEPANSTDGRDADKPVGATGLADVLTIEGFDFDKVIELIDASELNVLAKTAAKTALEQARSNPEILGDALEALRLQLTP